MFYIQRRDGRYLDQFETKSEARRMIIEYRLSDWAADYYISSRPCKNWLEVTEHGPEDFEHVEL